MGVHILTDGEQAAFFCSTSDWAFGPVFRDDGTHDEVERAEAFLRWLRKTPWKKEYEFAGIGDQTDPREMSDAGLERAYSDWRAQEEQQWAAEEKAIDDSLAEG
jgi:hypothetical protein